MSVLSILGWSIDRDSDVLGVTATVDNFTVTSWHWDHSDYEEEHGRAVCKTTILLAEPSDWPATEEEQIEFLDAYEPCWLLLEDT
jgi:hypothetical protein